MYEQAQRSLSIVGASIVTANQGVDMSASVENVLTDQMRPILDQLLELVAHEAVKQAIPVTRTYVDATVNYETDADEIVVTQAVALPAQPALDYWHHLADSVADWIKSLPRETGKMVSRRFAVAVIWDTNGEVL